MNLKFCCVERRFGEITVHLDVLGIKTNKDQNDDRKPEDDATRSDPINLPFLACKQYVYDENSWEKMTMNQLGLIASTARFDAVEVAGRNVMSTSSTVTTELVNHRYGEQAAEATNESLDAAGHAIGTAWAAFKIRKAHNPKSALKSSSLAKSAVKAAAAEMKAKNSK
ncbi:hypothetical protein GH714_016209 [Hevea brasiliensis]|uniref:Senescence domain-containing protein n=1 Tax=Hevea brasiliensis TaxID=3981 RepID=A0A6A6LXU6_HEVBR|nr:hypothetical protein GH714_016209 [Hevea brasiliensis]